MVLAGIVEEIMKDEDEVVVTYSNDGSSMSGVGSYVVQSFIINKKQRALPTLSIFSESRESLAELEKVTLKMLLAATGCKYSEKDILERITFVMTDSTAHNHNVIQDVCAEFETENTPQSLLCNVHPLMLFQHKINSVYQQIHDAMSDRKLKDCFLVNIDFKNESFIYKAMRCLVSFINKDFSSKPWSRQKHFDSFICPK